MQQEKSANPRFLFGVFRDFFFGVASGTKSHDYSLFLLGIRLLVQSQPAVNRRERNRRLSSQAGAGAVSALVHRKA
jgi:hypothetical protein